MYGFSSPYFNRTAGASGKFFSLAGNTRFLALRYANFKPPKIQDLQTQSSMLLVRCCQIIAMPVPFLVF